MKSGGMSSAAMAMTVAVLLAVVLMAPGVAAQSSAPACAQKLIPCGPYIGSTTKPPESCCGQIKEAVQKELPCLCSLLSNQQLLQALKLNLTQALELPKLCGVSSDTSICKTVSPSPGGSGAGAPAPSAPPATPGGGKNAGSAAVARLGASGFVCLLAFWWSLVA